ncbi:MAG TPA: TadA family conjugal transfer-associated ATPase [Humibacter sp.]|nr:TadA family conjugal transfer-associated ATPase [Humibacter sp.]
MAPGSVGGGVGAAADGDAAGGAAAAVSGAAAAVSGTAAVAATRETVVGRTDPLSAAPPDGLPSDPAVEVACAEHAAAPPDGGLDEPSDRDGDTGLDGSDDGPDSAEDWAQFGSLAPFVARPGVTDVFVNGSDGLWFEDGGGLRRDDAWWCDERGLRELAVRLVGLGGRHIDEATPCVDVRLRDGMRVHAVLPPISTNGTLLSIRIPRRRSFRFDELAAAGMVTVEQAARLRRAISARENLLVAGPAGSGKTTLLSALLAEAPHHERLVCIEDVAELRVRHPHVVSLEARQSNVEGAGEVGLARLVREALRMRPDRVVVGECRGAEVRELLSALNTGHDGGAGTLHANSLTDVPARLEALGALAGMSVEAVARQTVSAIGLVVQLERVGGTRRVSRMGRFEVDVHGRLTIAADGQTGAPALRDVPC